MGFLLRLLSEARPHSTLDLILALVLLLSLPLLRWLAARARSDGVRWLRKIPAYEHIPRLIGGAAEQGRSIHISLGTSGVGSGDTATSIASLRVLRYLADQAVAFNMEPVVTLSDPTLLPAAEDVLMQAYRRGGAMKAFRASNIQWVASDRVAFAAGLMEVLGHGAVSANLLFGRFGPEYPLIAEVGAKRVLDEEVGTDNLEAMPFLFASSGAPLLGEEIFASRAYLEADPIGIGSLYLQDLLRVALAVVIVGGVLVKTLMG